MIVLQGTNYFFFADWNISTKKELPKLPLLHQSPGWKPGWDFGEAVRGWKCRLNGIVSSLRSQVVCVNGILKEKYRGWKIGYNLKTHEEVAMALKAACVVHNMVCNWDEENKEFLPLFHTRLFAKGRNFTHFWSHCHLWPHQGASRCWNRGWVVDSSPAVYAIMHH